MKHIGVPLFDLKRQNQELADEVMARIKEVVVSGRFILGDAVREFEEKMSDYFGNQAVGVGSGTAALYLALKACGVSRGDEIITTPFTFISPVEMIMSLGARPVFVDIDPVTFNINPSLIAEKITDKTKAIVVVHLFGLSADMPEIMEIAQNYKLYIIEDVAQAFGAKVKGKLCGSLGDLGCFSFFPTKILSCYGDGGLVVSKDEQILERVRTLRIHGAKKKYYHDEVGFNSRLDELQAAILLVKLKYLDQWIGKRRKIAEMYLDGLEGLPVHFPVAPEDYFHVYHQFTIRVKPRDRLQSFMKEKGIGTAIYYPSPLHLQPVCRSLNYRLGEFPESEKACQEVMSLPMFPELTPREVELVVSVLSSFDW